MQGLPVMAWTGATALAPVASLKRHSLRAGDHEGPCLEAAAAQALTGATPLPCLRRPDKLTELLRSRSAGAPGVAAVVLCLSSSEASDG